MRDINFIKNIDNLGRIVIPMDIRRKLNISTGDVLSISCTDKDICLCKYSTLDNCKVEEIVNYFVDTFKLNVVLMDKEKVIFSNLVSKNIKIDGNIQLLINEGHSCNNSYHSYVFGDKKIDGYFNQVPIVTNEGIVGSLIVLQSDVVNAYEVCKLIAKLIMLQLNIS